MENNTEGIEQHVITYNVDLLVWYFTKNKNITSDIEKQKVFGILSYALLEDPHCFMRIVLYIANTRKTDEEELSYKILIHLLGSVTPEIILANLELFLKFGKKDDILYFIQIPSITERIIKYVKHIVKTDSDYEKLQMGTLINAPINRVVSYKPKMKLDNTWTLFLNQILDDPIFNGIII